MRIKLELSVLKKGGAQKIEMSSSNLFFKPQSKESKTFLTQLEV